MQPRDWIVRYRTEDDIAAVAARWRSAGHLDNAHTFNVPDFVQEVLVPQLNRKRNFILRFFDRKSNDESPGFVRFAEPMAMHLDRKVWTLARFNDPKPRFIVGHEIGHAVLHDDHSMTFSGDPAKHANIEKERSAEWQADTFAAHFLLPDHIIEEFSDLSEIGNVCRVDPDLVRQSLRAVEKTRDNYPYYENIQCECGNYTLRRSRDFLKCDRCGKSTQLL
jgi:Zn-dependent peptidase ImmA (M78 family)